jgi:hypothetical protein
MRSRGRGNIYYGAGNAHKWLMMTKNSRLRIFFNHEIPEIRESFRGRGLEVSRILCILCISWLTLSSISIRGGDGSARRPCQNPICARRRKTAKSTLYYCLSLAY